LKWFSVCLFLLILSGCAGFTEFVEATYSPDPETQKSRFDTYVDMGQPIADATGYGGLYNAIADLLSAGGLFTLYMLHRRNAKGLKDVSGPTKDRSA